MLRVRIFIFSTIFRPPVRRPWVRWYQSLQNFMIQGNPAAFTQDFVQAALGRYDSEGREATLAYYNDRTSTHSVNSLTRDIYGPWGMFIIDENDLIVAHPFRPELIGQDIKTIVDSDGYEVRQRDCQGDRSRPLDSSPVASPPGPLCTSRHHPSPGSPRCNVPRRRAQAELGGPSQRAHFRVGLL